MNKLSLFFTDKLISILVGTLFLTVLFLPYFRISSAGPGVEIIDLFLPLLLFIFVLKCKELSQKKIFYFLLIFASIILISIFVNARHKNIRDYYELFKLLKFALIIGLFSFVSYQEFLKKWIRPTFIILVVFNLVHYFGLFGFNDFLGEHYQAGERMSSFGYNSIGQPTYKRMLGFPCNPNNNAIVFLFFAAYFLPKRGTKFHFSTLTWFAVATVMLFLCQSRTALLAIGIILIIYSIPLIRTEFKKLGLVVGSVALSFLVSTIITRSSVGNEWRPSNYVNTYRLDYADSSANDSIIKFRAFNDPLKMYSRYSDSLDPRVIYLSTEFDTFDELRHGSTYMETLMDGSAFNTNSVQGRLIIWRKLWKMIKKKPIFGHGPYKEYFYNNGLYAESEYVLITWRYGFVGLGFYVFFLLYLLRLSYRRRRSETGMILFVSTLIMLISGLTNNPFSHQMIIILFGMSIGFFLNHLMNEKKKATPSQDQS
jgi:O-antigen ligase